MAEEKSFLQSLQEWGRRPVNWGEFFNYTRGIGGGMGTDRAPENYPGMVPNSSLTTGGSPTVSQQQLSSAYPVISDQQYQEDLRNAPIIQVLGQFGNIPSEADMTNLFHPEQVSMNQTQPISQPAEIVAQPVMQQAASSDPIGEAMARYLDNLAASEGLRKESTQYSLDQVKRAEQARAEANDPSKRSMNPLDWLSFGARNLLAPLALSPTMTRKQFMDKKYAAEEGATEEDIARARQQASDMANAVGQDNNLALAQLRQLGTLQGMEQGQKMNPLDYVLKQARARQAQAETSPEALDILEQLRGLSVEEANARIQHLRDSGKGVDPMSIILLKLLQGDLGQTGQSGQPDTASDFAWHE